MVMTMLEAKVDRGRVADLERAYRDGTSELPAEIVETFLVRDTADHMDFRILTIWKSREALDAMRASGTKPKGVQIFESAGATPKLTIVDVVANRKH